MFKEGKLYRKVGSIEYEVQLGGRTKTILVPFGKTEAVFKAFISNGGVIDPETGQMQTDILSLISSFKDVGNVLLTEYDENGKVVTEGNCLNLETNEVVSLFKLATEIVEGFIKTLTQMENQVVPTNDPESP